MPDLLRLEHNLLLAEQDPGCQQHRQQFLVNRQPHRPREK